MKLSKLLLSVVVCLNLVSSAVLLADDGTKRGAGKRGGRVPGEQIKTDCPDCQSIAEKINTKEKEIRELMKNNRPKIESTDDNPPPLEMRENEEGNDNPPPRMKEKGPGKMPAGMLEKIKEDNPELYKKIVEIEDLCAQLKVCEENCKSTNIDKSKSTGNK
ncbi:MAG: hypothetical protein A2231_07455 [Candidatus Firestonebacteria bacterium RIFOXYA2_FULL_40_8]|nr:MAG: hypothetical protein A2231_07455 [Candidatus Firestonebacteria bacterium RIFOXYA2_FULL_40_8]